MNRPDIVFINCHDLGRHLSVYGESTASTPALDRLAGEGVVFDRFFSTATMCSPSRGSILTGRYPHQVGLFGLTNRGWDLNRDEKALPAFLSDAGYRTVLIGLQHGTRRADALGYRERLPMPVAHPAPVWSVAKQACDLLASLGPRESREPLYLNVGIFEPHRHDYQHHLEKLGLGESEYADAYRRLAERRAAAIRKDPRFRLPGFLPDMEDVRKDMSRYESWIMAMDEGVGMILDALARAGLEKDTVVLFTTDHGVAFPRAKCTVYDAGIGVTALARWSGRLPAGRRNGDLWSHVDWLPTLLDMLSLKQPDNIEGRSFLPALLGRSYTPRAAVFAEGTYHNRFNPMRCVRTQRHKLIRNYAPVEICTGTKRGDRNNAPLGRESYPPLWNDAPPEWELYDLDEDPHEHHNLAGESDLASTETGLREQLAAWLERTGDPIARMFASYSHAAWMEGQRRTAERNA